MRKLLLSALTALTLPIAANADNAQECKTDSAEILAYSALDGSGGLKIAYKCCCSGEWKPIGNGYTFVSSDFGPWGSHKKMFSPTLSKDTDGWTATWIADTEDAVVATAKSADLMKWEPQTYHISDSPRAGITQYLIGGQAVNGTVTRVPKALIDTLCNYAEERGRLNALYGELMKDDPTRFADLGDLKYTVKAEPKKAKTISDKLIGIFFEDINYGADGGLYAELVQNRDFEYVPADHRGDKNWNATYAWEMPDKDKGSFGVSTMNPIHPNNQHYLTAKAKAGGYRIINNGYDGIPVKSADNYLFSMKAHSKTPVGVIVSLITPDGTTLASDRIAVSSGDWEEYTTSLRPVSDCNDARLQLTIEAPTTVNFDMVSLFPEDTFMGRKNGLRKDLAQTLADMHPRFMRFPGGCVAHGDGVDNIYDWKGSIGPLEARKPLPNIWRYHQSRGLGYYEYFLFCEDIGAEPLPVLAAGVPCQNSGTSAHHSHDAITKRGQQGGIPMEEMDAYVQDVLDLIEYANGDPSTTWGEKRAEAGHPEPFNLKYIGIGNEDMITEVFTERFKMIYDAVKKAHPEVEVVGTVGPFYEGSDYDAGWQLARELDIPLVDEHYYVAPGWMIYNQDYYDEYKRGGTRVYLGEYAAHVPGRKSNMETALAEALYLTSVERNGDIVEMTSYAPLLARKGHTQWTPDLIYFDNAGVYPTTDYYTQKLFGNNTGSQYIPAETKLNVDNEKAQARVGSSILYDEATGDYIVKLVNLLPKAVDANVDLSGLKINAKSKISAQILAGDPEDRNATPRPIDIRLKTATRLDYQMPPYSLTIVRIAKK